MRTRTSRPENKETGDNVHFRYWEIKVHRHATLLGSLKPVKKESNIIFRSLTIFRNIHLCIKLFAIKML